MLVNVISESAFTVQGHGVHSAFTDTVDALRDYTDWQVATNANVRADVVHLHTVGPYSLSKLLFARGGKVVSAHVTPDSFVGSLVGARWWKSAAELYLRWFYNRADAIVAVSDDVTKELRLMKVKKPIFMVPNMISVSRFEATKDNKQQIRKELGIGIDDFVVLGCGQVQPRKRIDTFVLTAQQVEAATFLWVGGIPFKRLAAGNGEMSDLMARHPKNVTFTGLVSREETIKYFKACDVFFLPSSQETFGLVVVEGAAAGLPLVLRDLEVYKSLFHGHYLAGDDQDFGRIIETLISDHGEFAGWARKSKELAQKYDSKVVVQQLVEVYEEVAGIRLKTKK